MEGGKKQRQKKKERQRERQTDIHEWNGEMVSTKIVNEGNLT